MSKICHGEVDHENDGLILLADEAAQNPQGCTVSQETRDEYEDIGGCIQRVLKCQTCDIAITLSSAGTIAAHLEHLTMFIKLTYRVMAPVQRYRWLPRGCAEMAFADQCT